ncbi:VDE1 [Symbiodinium microadriaticum]|nr:VDE1 [Symbiodinium microadriaticum]CAE7868325.1 VDE1 [Symbiodinium sp. KB8]
MVAASPFKSCIDALTHALQARVCPIYVHVVEPSSYEIPTAMDDRAVVMTATERFMESVENAANGFSIFEEMDATPKQAGETPKRFAGRMGEAQVFAKSILGCLGLDMAKENHRPSSMTPRADREKIFCQARAVLHFAAF